MEKGHSSATLPGCQRNCLLKALGSRRSFGRSVRGRTRTSRVVSNAQRPFEELARNAQRAGTVAWTKLNEAYLVVDDQVKRTATQVNNRYEVSRKAREAANQVSEQAKSVDSRYGLKRRLRNFADDIERKWPIWKTKYAEFSNTLPGQAVFLMAIFLLFWSGVAWRLLNLVFIAWWLSPFIFLLLSKVNNKNSQKAARQRQRKQQQQQANYFNAFFTGQRQRRQQQAGNDYRRKYDGPDEGPVIDIEYTTIDE